MLRSTSVSLYLVRRLSQWRYDGLTNCEKTNIDPHGELRGRSQQRCTRNSRWFARVAPEGTEVELHDLFAEAYGSVNEFVRKGYLALVNFAPGAWGAVYRWLDRKKDFDTEFARFSRLKDHFAALLERFQPDVMICTFPAYPNVLRQIQERNSDCSLGLAKLWLWSRIQLLSTRSGIGAPPIIFSLRTSKAPPSCEQPESPLEKIKVFGFPVSPKFADSARSNRVLPPQATLSAAFYT